MQVKYFCLKLGAYNNPPRHYHNKNAAATAKDFFCLLF